MMDDDILRFRIDRIIRLKRTDNILLRFMRCDLSGRSRIPVRMNDQRAEAILGRHPLLPFRKAVSIWISCPHEISYILLDHALHILEARVVESMNREICRRRRCPARHARNPYPMHGA